jgi:hypothetical protein
MCKDLKEVWSETVNLSNQKNIYSCEARCSIS